jgi:1-acyl-sn-glycerol-3-phosphate acyltransferase
MGVNPVVYHGLRHPARGLLRVMTGLRAEGLEHVPESGPFFLLPNHQSAVDPVLVQSVLRREVHSMTKSTQFSSWAMRWILIRLGAFPVRRFQVDPHTVRMTLRLLDEGEGVCIYPEGERSWDGRLRPFRTGTLKLVLRAGVPVIPVGIQGTFEFWPRWLSVPQPGAPAVVRFGRPLRFGRIRDREERIRRLPETEWVLCREIQRLARVELSPRLKERLARYRDDPPVVQEDGYVPGPAERASAADDGPPGGGGPAPTEAP